MPYRWKFTQECFNVLISTFRVFFIKLSFFFVSKSNFIIFSILCAEKNFADISKKKLNLFFLLVHHTLYWKITSESEYWIFKRFISSTPSIADVTMLCLDKYLFTWNVYFLHAYTLNPNKKFMGADDDGKYYFSHLWITIEILFSQKKLWLWKLVAGVEVDRWAWVLNIE